MWWYMMPKESKLKGFQTLEATSEDVSAIAKLHTISWQENYRTVFSDDFLDNELLDDRMNVWTQRLANPSKDQFILLIKKAGHLTGFMCAYIDEHKEYGTLLDNLHVAKQYQGLGLGKGLMEQLVSKIQNRGGDTGLYLWVLQQNHAATQFYRRLGGNLIETVEGNDIGDRPFLKCRYHWKCVETLQGKLNL